MLNKLLKYEWKATSKLILLSYAALVGVILIDLLAKLLGFAWTEGLAFMGVMFVSFGVSLVGAIVICIRFYRNLYRDEGYLTHALPVTPNQLMASKTIVGYVWTVISTILAVVGVAAGLIILDPSSWETIRQLFNPAVMKWMPIFGAIFLVEMMMFLQQIYFSVTLGNTTPFQRSPVLFSILIYFGLYIVMQIIDTALMLLFPLSVHFSETGVSLGFQPMITEFINTAINHQTVNTSVGFDIGIGSILGDLAAAILLPIFNIKLMKKKLSLR